MKKKRGPKDRHKARRELLELASAMQRSATQRHRLSGMRLLTEYEALPEPAASSSRLTARAIAILLTSTAEYRDQMPPQFRGLSSDRIEALILEAEQDREKDARDFEAVPGLGPLMGIGLATRQPGLVKQRRKLKSEAD